MNEDDRKECIRRYNERLKEYGKDPRTLGWLKGRQPIRFKALTQIGDLEGMEVLDIGCGFGDLYGYLKSQDISVDYSGWDINPNLIEIAREEHPDGNFSVVDVSKHRPNESFDFVISSGIFNYQTTKHEEFIHESLSKMMEIANRGIATDFMTSYVDYHQEKIYYAEPEEIFRYCKSLSKRVNLRHDYLPYEFCVYVYNMDEVNEKSAFETYDGLI